jgi:hypothetical protein
MNKQIGRCGRDNKGGFRRSATIAGLAILVSFTFRARADPPVPATPPLPPTDAGHNVRDRAASALKAQIHEKQVIVAELPERPVAGSPAAPVDLLTFDAGKVPDRIELEAPFQLDDIAVDRAVGPLLRIGRRGPTFAGNVSHPYAEVAVANGRLTWAWKEPLPNSKQDELILAWIHCARLRLYAGRQEVGSVEFAAAREQTLALSSLKPEPLLLGIPARFLVLKPAGALPEGWAAPAGAEAPPVKQPHLVLRNSKDPLVSFALDLDLQSGAAVSSWAQQRSNAQDRSAAALAAVDGLQQRQRQLNEQLDGLRKAQAGPNAGSGNLDAIRSVHTELYSIPPAIEHQQAIGKQWQQRQVMYEAVGPFDVEIAAAGNGQVLYRLHVVKDADEAAANGQAAAAGSAPPPPPQPGRGGAGGTTEPAAGRPNRFPSQ